MLNETAKPVTAFIRRSIPECLYVLALLAVIRGVFINWGEGWASIIGGLFGIGTAFALAASANAVAEQKPKAEPIRRTG